MQDSTGIGFFAIRAQERDPVAYEFHLKSYEDLLDLHIPAILEGAPGYRLFQRQQPLYLVCTNGRRDQCCARFGFPLFTELRRLAEGQVWQVTHVGGHRFAANLYCLPHGLLYGRLQAGDATAIIESYKHGQILVEHYCGRTCYAQIAQVADYFLRRSSQVVGIGSFHLEGAEEIDPRRWRVQFSATSGQVHRLTLAVEQTDEQVYESCLMDKTTLLFEHSLINHEIF